MEIVVRALFAFQFLWFVTRVTGNATLGELSTFQLVLYIVIGDLIQQGVTQQDASLTGAALAVSVFALCTVAISWASHRWPALRVAVKGAPVVVVRDGELQPEAMASERMTTDDLYEAAREQGIRRVAGVELAVLEVDGKISFSRRHGNADRAPEKPRAGP